VVGGTGGVTGSASEAVGVLGDEHAAPVLGGGVGGERLRGLQAGASVAFVGAERLVVELADDGPAFAFGERTAVGELGADAAVRVLGALRAVDHGSHRVVLLTSQIDIDLSR